MLWIWCTIRDMIYETSVLNDMTLDNDLGIANYFISYSKLLLMFRTSNPLCWYQKFTDTRKVSVIFLLLRMLRSEEDLGTD